MTILHIDHFTLRTAKVEETVAFFRDAIGMEEGWRPAFPFPGKWMYVGDRPLVHVANLATDDSELMAYLGNRTTGAGGGSLDHISLRCQGLAEHQRLSRLNLHTVEIKLRAAIRQRRSPYNSPPFQYSLPSGVPC